jgi:hypothetical protein
VPYLTRVECRHFIKLIDLAEAGLSRRPDFAEADLEEAVRLYLDSTTMMELRARFLAKRIDPVAEVLRVVGAG